MKLLPCAVMFLLSGISAAYATDPTVKDFEVTGNITQPSCQLEPSASVSMTPIAFDKLEDAATVKANGVGENAVAITLTATQCSIGEVGATIEGVADSTDASLLGIDTGDSVAKNVAIAFAAQSEESDGKKTFIAVNTDVAAPGFANGGDLTEHTFYFFAEPVKTSTTAQPGTIHATAQIHIVYL